MQKTKDKLFASVYKRKDFGFGLIFLGAIFLINPQYGIFDFLPDFIGLLMIYSGLAKLADLDVRLTTSRKRFFAGMWASVGAFAFMLMFLFFSFDSSTNLTISLGLNVLNIVFLIPAFTNLYLGVTYLKMRCDEKSGEIQSFDNLKVLTVVFIFLKSILSFAPEIAELLKDSEEFRDMNLTTIKVVITAISWVIILAIGIYWVVSLKKFINTITSDETFISYLNDRYDNEIGCDTHLLNVRKIKAFSILCMVAYIFTLCMPLDGFLYMPEFVFGILLYFAFRQASEYLPTANDKYNGKLDIMFYLIASFSNYILRLVYSTNYANILYPFDPKMAEPTQFWIIYGFIIITTVFSYYFMYKIAKKIFDIRNNMIDNCVGLKNTDSQYRLELDETRKKELKKKSKAVYIIQVIYAILSGVCMLLVPFHEVIMPFSIYWIYRFVFCIVTVVAIYVIGSDLNDEAERMI